MGGRWVELTLRLGGLGRKVESNGDIWHNPEIMGRSGMQETHNLGHDDVAVVGTHGGRGVGQRAENGSNEGLSSNLILALRLLITVTGVPWRFF